jgi:hypothetical protein
MYIFGDYLIIFMRKYLIVGLISLVLMAGGLASARDFGYVSEFFTDSDSFSEWYRSDLWKLKSMGVVKGYEDGTFRPNNNVTRAEMSVMLARMEGYNLYAEDIIGMLGRYDQLVELGVKSHLASNLAIAGSGLYLTDEPDQNIESCLLIEDLPISSAYIVYDCGYDYVINILDDSFDRPYGAVDLSIDKWYVSSITARDFGVPNLFEAE